MVKQPRLGLHPPPHPTGPPDQNQEIFFSPKRRYFGVKMELTPFHTSRVALISCVVLAALTNANAGIFLCRGSGPTQEKEGRHFPTCVGIYWRWPWCLGSARVWLQILQSGPADYNPGSAPDVWWVVFLLHRGKPTSSRIPVVIDEGVSTLKRTSSVFVHREYAVVLQYTPNILTTKTWSYISMEFVKTAWWKPGYWISYLHLQSSLSINKRRASCVVFRHKQRGKSIHAFKSSFMQVLCAMGQFAIVACEQRHVQGANIFILFWASSAFGGSGPLVLQTSQASVSLCHSHWSKLMHLHCNSHTKIWVLGAFADSEKYRYRSGLPPYVTQFFVSTTLTRPEMAFRSSWDVAGMFLGLLCKIP